MVIKQKANKLEKVKNYEAEEQKIHKQAIELVVNFLKKLNSKYVNAFLKSNDFDLLKKDATGINAFLSDTIGQNKEHVIRIIEQYREILRAPNASYDRAWKDILPLLLHDILKNFCPDIYEVIDWTKNIEDANAELPMLIGGSYSLNRTADKVFKVSLKEVISDNVIYTYSFGKKDKPKHFAFLTVHIDVQNQKTIIFGKRMFQMDYRLIDMFDIPVYPIAITSFNTNNIEEFYYKVGETKIGCEFKCINLLNFKDNEVDSQNNNNLNKELLQKMKAEKSLLPFVIEAHLKALNADTECSGQERIDSLSRVDKIAADAFSEMITYEFDKEQITAFCKFLRWMLHFNKNDTDKLGGYMLNTQQINTADINAILHNTYGHKIEEYLESLYYKKVEATEALQKEMAKVEAKVKEEVEARKKEAEARKKEVEARKKEVEARKKEVEARKRELAETSYRICKIRGLNPHLAMSKDAFVDLAISAQVEELKKLIDFSEEVCNSFEEVLVYVKNNCSK